jgi:hypothetical protein
MSNGNDILSVVFLALICIIITGLVKGLVPSHSGLIVPSFIFICVGLWIAYDYMMINRYKEKEKCMTEKHAQTLHEMQAQSQVLINDMSAESVDDRNIPDIEVPDEPETPLPKREQKPEKTHDNEYDIDIHNQLHNIKNMHNVMGSSGDTMICNRMKYMAVQSQLSKDIRSSWNKYSVQPWIEEELREHADREWWNSDHLDVEF